MASEQAMQASGCSRSNNKRQPLAQHGKAGCQFGERRVRSAGSDGFGASLSGVPVLVLNQPLAQESKTGGEWN